ncbi:MAG TPA: DUF6542 domain-containing protein [Streptosporangiaceae bacterium]|nr:DUF6542 domain-containing protein [Streptosporangiaceae bacterium]
MTQTRAQTPTRAPAPDRKTVPRLEPQASVRLTGRGALAALFVLCFFTQLIADWTGWGTLAGAAFVCGCGAVTYYTRTSGLRSVVVAPPLLFFAGSTCAELITAPGTFLAATGILVTLGTSAPWLFTGTALTVVVAIGRGYRPAIRWPGGSFPGGAARLRGGSAGGSSAGGSSAGGSSADGSSARGGRPGGR